MFFCVENRFLPVKEYSYNFIGEYSDILQININIDYIENTTKQDIAPLADEIVINTRKE